MITTAFVNQKGGVGKSSLTFHLGGALAELGLRVLLIDYDPQASLAQAFLGPDQASALPPDLTAAAIAAGKGADPADVILPSGTVRGLDFVPGSIAAAVENLADPYGPRVATRMQLRHFLAEAAQERGYDRCLIDCPPNLATLSAQALAAADSALIPTSAEDFGAQGIRPVLEFIGQAALVDNPNLVLAGIVINRRVRNRSIHNTFEGRLRDFHAERMFRAVVHEKAGYPEAISYQTPITLHDRRSEAADEVRELANEFLARTGGDLP